MLLFPQPAEACRQHWPDRPKTLFLRNIDWIRFENLEKKLKRFDVIPDDYDSLDNPNRRVDFCGRSRQWPFYERHGFIGFIVVRQGVEPVRGLEYWTFRRDPR